MKRYHYHAVVSLYPTEQGGLASALPGRTRRLVVRAPDPDTAATRLFSSVVATDDDRPLVPGDAHVLVTMQLNEDDAAASLSAGDHFTFWLGSDVGGGTVSRRVFTWL